jgi:hypothetical protein
MRGCMTTRPHAAPGEFGNRSGGDGPCAWAPASRLPRTGIDSTALRNVCGGRRRVLPGALFRAGD